MDLIINSDKTFLFFINEVKNEMENMKKDELKKSKISKILENIVYNGLLPNLDQNNIDTAIKFLNELNGVKTKNSNVITKKNRNKK